MRTLGKIVIAPTAFKGSLDPIQAAEAMERGVRRILPHAETVLVPLADGGDGMLKCLVRAGVCYPESRTVHDALGRLQEALYGISPDGETGFIEMAQICGLAQLLPEERDPRRTTTFGVGEMIVFLRQRGVRRLVIGLGGSATNDGGSGALSALGWRLLERDGAPIAAGNAGLRRLRTVIPASCPPGDLEVILAADVRNPLLGRRGATMVFAPQKGATPDMLPEMERAMRRWAIAVHRAIGRKLSQVSGAGAAGGIAFGLMAHFPQARLVSGAQFVMEATGFESALKGAALVLTGEGRLDETTLHGKLTERVLRASRRARVPVAIVCGEFAGDTGALKRFGVVACETLVSNEISPAQAMREAEQLAEEKIAKLLERVKRLLGSRARRNVACPVRKGYNTNNL